MLRALFICLSLLARPALAETAMTAAAFEEYVAGRTLYYEADGQRYGAEQYLKNRFVRWSYLDGSCKEGRWFGVGPEDRDICFVYEDEPEPQCWRFYETTRGLRAEFTGPDGDNTLYEVLGDSDPLICPGPDVGV